MACFRGNQEFYGEILLLDDTKITLMTEQGIKRSSKAAAILQHVFSHLNVVEVEFFGLRFCDDKTQTRWLDPLKTLSRHRGLMGPPYIFYFGVKFYAENPSKLKEETRRQFYLQLRQDICRGRLLCPAHLRPRLSALMLQADRGDVTEEEELGENQEVQRIYKSLSGVSRPQAQNLFLSLCSSLTMYGVSLFNAYGENQSEYFLGPTPVGVVIYKNKVLVGKYFWQRINKLHFKNKTFELRVVGKNGSETSFFFHTSDESDCKRLWRCCVEHHVFFRMSESNRSTHKLRHKSIACSPTLASPRLNVGELTNKSVRDQTTTKDLCLRLHPNHTQESKSSDPVMTQTAPPAVHRSEGGAKEDVAKPFAPWENSGPVRGLFNPKFPANTKEDPDGERRQWRSRSLDGDQPIRQQRRRRSRSRGNTSSGSESETIRSNERRRRRKNRQSPDVVIWQHIQKQLVDPNTLPNRQSEEIPYMEVRVSGEPIRVRHSPRRRRHRRCTSASDFLSKTELVPPLPVTKTTGTLCQLPISP
ncbi:band 4.1-like protein 4 isoform X2 [Paralichthys olivaceus]|uniref:band 4.1-like protein 4 isoform X2 n=1 Tax=Paralichthys olivaceus TaxID=8255 RepID=UPI003753CA7A